MTMLLPFFTKREAQSLRQLRGRVYLRPPLAMDYRAWTGVREESRAFLTPWEPTWPHDALSRRSSSRRLNTGVTPILTAA